MPTPLRFRAPLTRPAGTGTSTFVMIPFDIPAHFDGRKRVPVNVTLNGHAYRTTVAVYGGQYYLGVNAAVRKAAGVQAGDDVEVVLERDDAPRVVEVPADLAAALAGVPAAQAAWEALSYSHQKEHLDWINDAKQAATRERRIAKWVGVLVEKAKAS